MQYTGLKRAKFDECLSNPAIADGVASVKQKGTSYGVTEAPTFFVNGKKVAGAVSYEEMKGVIDAALPAQPQAEPAAKAAAKAT